MSPYDSRGDVVMDGRDNGVAPLNLRRLTCFLPPTLTGESPAQGPETGACWLPLEKPVGGAVGVREDVSGDVLGALEAPPIPHAPAVLPPELRG